VTLPSTNALALAVLNPRAWAWECVGVNGALTALVGPRGVNELCRRARSLSRSLRRPEDPEPLSEEVLPSI